MFFLLFFSCQNSFPQEDCIQIDILPEALLVYSQNQTEIQLAACTCAQEEQECQESDLLSDVTLQLTSSIGTLSKQSVYLSSGQGSVKINGNGDPIQQGIAVIQAELGSYTNQTTLEMRSNLPAHECESIHEDAPDRLCNHMPFA